MSLRNITPKETTLIVSSTFDKSSNKKNLLDGNPETCWSSQQGLPQHIHMKLPNLMPVTHLALTFQGGFSGTTVGLYLASERAGTQGTEGGFDVGLIFAGKIYPKDGNGRQVFELPIPEAIPDSIHSSGPHTEGSELTEDERQKHWVKEIKLEFEKSADPWGRIVVYDLEVLSKGKA